MKRWFAAGSKPARVLYCVSRQRMTHSHTMSLWTWSHAQSCDEIKGAIAYWISTFGWSFSLRVGPDRVLLNSTLTIQVEKMKKAFEVAFTLNCMWVIRYSNPTNSLTWTLFIPMYEWLQFLYLLGSSPVTFKSVSKHVTDSWASLFCWHDICVFVTMLGTQFNFKNYEVSIEQYYILHSLFWVFDPAERKIC